MCSWQSSCGSRIGLALPVQFRNFRSDCVRPLAGARIAPVAVPHLAVMLLQQLRPPLLPLLFLFGLAGGREIDALARDLHWNSRNVHRGLYDAAGQQGNGHRKEKDSKVHGLHYGSPQMAAA